MKSYPRLVYMGTPEFSVPGLKKLVSEGYHVVAVVTTPDKPAGRGLKMQSSPLKKAALDLGIPVLEPVLLKSDDFYQTLKQLNPDLQIVVAFKKLPDRIWQLPPLGTFNLHASLLPQYRGAAPIHWAIINGEKETGLTTFFINDKIDEGNILLQRSIPIDDDMTTGQLHDLMLEPGADLILKTLEGIVNRTIVPRKQEYSESLKPAPKIYKETCRINWDKTATEVHNQIRGLSPHPGAYTHFQIHDKIMTVKILKSYLVKSPADLLPPKQISFNKKELFIGCASGAIGIERIMPEGRKEMNISDFINGLLRTEKSIRLVPESQDK